MNLIKHLLPIAYNILKKAMHDDPNYAWSWHQKVREIAFEEGLGYNASHTVAAKVMQKAFDLDTSKNPHYTKV